MTSVVLSWRYATKNPSCIRILARPYPSRLVHVFASTRYRASPFSLQAQYKFLSSKGKTAPAMTFLTLKTLRPLWSQLLTKEARG